MLLAFINKLRGKKQPTVKPKVIYEPYKFTEFDNEILTLINKFRKQNNKPLLAVHPVLCSLAYDHCKYMVKKGKASHDFFILRSSEFPNNYYCENVAYNFKTPTGFVNAWINSEAHKENMLTI